jgi:aldehyde dehydrogenase (NAD+)
MIEKILKKQRDFFETQATKSFSFRMNALRKLEDGIRKNEQHILEALKQDLNKSAYEAYLTEIGIVLDEIRYHKKHLKGWMRSKKVRPALAQLPGSCHIFPEPYGTVLIMSPWNYPVNLCFEPLIGAISGGNTVVIKPLHMQQHQLNNQKNH